MLKVMEKFYSIQGEGPNAGVPSIFVRIQGCTLSCPYCDSQQASRCLEPPKYVINNEEEAIKFADLISTAPKDEYPASFVVITGGEPLLRKNLDLLLPFCNYLCWKKNMVVDFETTMITAYPDLKTSNVGKNVETVLNKISKKKEPHNGHFVVCPKLDPVCYPSSVTIDEILNFYTNLNSLDECEIFTTWCNFKVVYYPEIEDNIKKFLELADKTFDFFGGIRNLIYMMPMTPIGSNYSRDSYVESCEKTIDFCKKNALNYSPRIHIDVWGLKQGV